VKEPYADEVSARRLAPLLILLAAAIALILAVASMLQHSWGLLSAHDVSGNRLHGPAPALETAPQNALQDYLAQKKSRLDGYAWIDPAQHLARIPIEEAMRALTQGGAQPGSGRAAYLMGVAGGAKKAGAGGRKHSDKAAAAKRPHAAGHAKASAPGRKR
jgi:hypothetical protein